MTTNWPEVLGVLTERADLSAAQAQWAMDEIMSGAATSAQIAAFGVAMRMKGPTATELTGLATGMLAHAHRVTWEAPAVDIVGTGGDRCGSVNISTMAAVVVAAAGIPVIKHGNRALSSRSGGADVLAALGVAIELGPTAVAQCVHRTGIGFCFAPLYHPALRHANAARKELGIPTVFNVLGPLTNPAQPSAGLIGCAFADLLPVVAGAFAERGANALVVRGDDGLDEITTAATSHGWLVAGGQRTEITIDPTRLGIAPVQPEQLRGGDPDRNAAIARDMFAGAPGAVRDTVLLNAAATIAIYELNPATGGIDIHQLLADAVPRAAHAVDSGAATALLQRWVTVSNQLHQRETS